MSPDFKGRAADQGLTPAELAAELAEIKGAGVAADGAPDAQERAVPGPDGPYNSEKAKAAAIAAGLQGLASPAPGLKPKVAAAKQAVALLVAQKQLALLRRKVREARAEVDSSAEGSSLTASSRS